MRLFYKLSAIALLLLLSHKQSKAITISNDTVIYKQVIDSLIQIALVHNQLRPLVIISESKRLRKPRGSDDENLSYTIHSYAQDSVDYLHNAQNYKVLENKKLRNILLSIKQFERGSIPIFYLKSPAQISYKVNAWAIFKNQEKITRYRKKNPDFFCAADVTKPIYVGDYALVVIDRQFNTLGGGGYMHIFKKADGKWQTYALVNLWHY